MMFGLLPVEVYFSQYDDDEVIRTPPGSPSDAPAQVLLSHDSDQRRGRMVAKREMVKNTMKKTMG